MMTYDEYISAVIRAKNENPDWRWGQTYFNVLWQKNHGLASFIAQTELDPFYRDDRIQPFLARLHDYYLAFGSVTDERIEQRD